MQIYELDSAVNELIRLVKVTVVHRKQSKICITVTGVAAEFSVCVGGGAVDSSWGCGSNATSNVLFLSYPWKSSKYQAVADEL